MNVSFALISPRRHTWGEDVCLHKRRGDGGEPLRIKLWDISSMRGGLRDRTLKRVGNPRGDGKIRVVSKKNISREILAIKLNCAEFSSAERAKAFELSQREGLESGRAKVLAIFSRKGKGLGLGF